MTAWNARFWNVRVPSRKTQASITLLRHRQFVSRPFESKCLSCYDGGTAKDFASTGKLEGYIREHSVNSIVKRLDSKDPKLSMPRDDVQPRLRIYFCAVTVSNTVAHHCVWFRFLNLHMLLSATPFPPRSLLASQVL